MRLVAKQLGILTLLAAAGCSSSPLSEGRPPNLGRAPISSRLAAAEMENLEYDSGPRGPRPAPTTRIGGTSENSRPSTTDSPRVATSSVGKDLDPTTSESVPPVAASKSSSSPRPQIIGQIVRGTPAPGRSIATVDIERCFDLIPSYRKVHAERSSKEYARYLLLLTQANDEFRQAVDWIALREGVDVVVEKGGVVGARTVDITSEVCERLREQQGDYTR